MVGLFLPGAGTGSGVGFLEYERSQNKKVEELQASMKKRILRYYCTCHEKCLALFCTFKRDFSTSILLYPYLIKFAIKSIQ